MPMYDFICPDKHETTRSFPVNQIHYLPEYIKCKCNKRAKRVKVYTPGIGGDLPTRGAF